MEIYLMQHGEAHAEDQDPERSLTPGGEDQIRSSGKALKKLGVDVDLIGRPYRLQPQEASAADGGDRGKGIGLCQGRDCGYGGLGALGTC